ncbi:MAG: hypothetical protein WAU68_01555 [Vitreimonas sp.]
MKKLLAMAVAASALALAAPASAQAWQNINQRQAQLDSRIDAGVRDGSLTRQEAFRLRGEFNDLARLEARYRVDGLSYGERADLDRRFDALSSQIRYQRNDGQDRGDRGGWNDGRGNDDRGNNGWMNINDRQRQLEFRINEGLRDRSLSRVEAARLRMEFNTIARLEARYRADGLNRFERADLQRRFDGLSNRIMAERRDRNNWYG